MWLVTHIVPDAKVTSAMNDINAAQREQVAANARSEAEKILVVRKAEAEAESKAVRGQGIANQGKAIIEGLLVSIVQFQKVVDDASAKEVMQLVMVTQYFDTLKSIGESDRTNTLLLSDFAVDAGGRQGERLSARPARGGHHRGAYTARRNCRLLLNANVRVRRSGKGEADGSSTTGAVVLCSRHTSAETWRRTMRVASIRSMCATSARSARAAKVEAVPPAPARPVRPTR